MPPDRSAAVLSLPSAFPLPSPPALTWEHPPPLVALGPGEVHVWCASLDPGAAGLPPLLAVLSLDERRRAQRLRFEEDRRRFIAGRAILRSLLGRYLQREPRLLHFRYGPAGKPVLAEAGGAPLRFNLSHSQGLALYAFSLRAEVGVDLEVLRPMPNLAEVALRFFSTREKGDLLGLAPPAREEAFFGCWTRKEAYLKALGDGLSRPLADFAVSLLPGQPAALLADRMEPSAVSRWTLTELRPAAGFVGALAVEGIGFDTRRWRWSSGVTSAS